MRRTIRTEARKNRSEEPSRMIQTMDHRHHIRSLDGLRGIAILLVFFFHYYPRTPVTPVSLLAGLGWLGVNLFFSLSGFLITGILFDTRMQAGFFRKFYARRALRLFPVYIVMVIVVLAVSAHFGEHPTWWALPFFLYGSNIVGNLQLPLGVGHHIELGHLWSLSLEEQFYMVWPPLLFLLRKRETILRACIAGIVFSVILRAVIVLHPVGMLDVYNELPTQLDGLLAGGLLALLLRSEKHYAILQPKLLRTLIAIAVLVLAACIAKGHTSHWSNPTMRVYGYFAATVAFFAFIALALRPTTWTHRVGSWTPLRLLGRYSYGFYLWHQLPETFFENIIRKTQATVPIIGGPLGAAIVFALSLACAVASYHLIELPFLRMKKFFAYGDEKRAHHLHADQSVDLHT